MQWNKRMQTFVEKGKNNMKGKIWVKRQGTGKYTHQEGRGEDGSNMWTMELGLQDLTFNEPLSPGSPILEACVFWFFIGQEPITHGPYIAQASQLVQFKICNNRDSWWKVSSYWIFIYNWMVDLNNFQKSRSHPSAIFQHVRSIIFKTLLCLMQYFWMVRSCKFNS